MHFIALRQPFYINPRERCLQWDRFPGRGGIQRIEETRMSLKCVKTHLEGVDRELELSAHGVDELQLHVATVSQGDEWPAVAGLVDFDHFANVGFLQGAGWDALAADAVWEQFQERRKHSLFHLETQLTNSV